MSATPIIAALFVLLQGTTDGDLRPTQETGSKIFTQPKKNADPALAARYSKRVAGCTYNRMGGTLIDRYLRASDPISTNLDGVDLDWARVEQAIEFCMGYHMEEYNADVRMSRIAFNFTQNRLRALLLEEAYLAENESSIQVAADASELTSRAFVSQGDALKSAQGLGNFADCVVYRDAAGADSLLRTEPGSDQERDAARALAPVLGICLIDGQTIEFTAASIRAIAADGLWSRAAYGSKEG
ncbi:hypothetical protein P7228_14310 [Altererythrobacter arenosus]|uniref:Uncharacterized protein n=1 Tax=Altererythrobacter arenosus TaxID=3032592 RepID=A0ABY8FQM1_9SPHN|nr:hypothetical protein [Altererythrobacter sp. CAU 1644]WFL77147.1 hypothetical protein P7228_14310 [Altererythrobacter sp. CAU 1644]